jgi:thymidine phosphorylase
MRDIASHFGLETVTVISDGSQPVGRAIGPALEMRDVLTVLRCEPDAPADLRQRALAIAAAVLELGGVAAQDCGAARASELLATGAAYEKFKRICIAQGGFREPTVANLQQIITSDRPGRVTEIDNRRVARIAKFAGAPDDTGAGVMLHMRLGDEVSTGQPLMTLYADSQSELAYALNYARSVGLAIKLEG